MIEKILAKVSSNGRILIPKEWREILGLTDGCIVELGLNEEKIITIKRKVHPLAIEDDLFDGVPPFTGEELNEAKKSIFAEKLVSQK